MTLAARTWRARIDSHEVWGKHPSGAERISVDLTDIIHSDETIQTATWSVTAPLTATNQTNTTTTASALISAGDDGGNYLVTLTAVTQGGYGRTIVWRCTVSVRDPVA